MQSTIRDIKEIINLWIYLDLKIKAGVSKGRIFSLDLDGLIKSQPDSAGKVEPELSPVGPQMFRLSPVLG